MPIIYHVTTAAEWNTAKERNYYESPSLKTEGFIHCSAQHQVEGVLEKYFQGKTGLIKLVIDTEKLTSNYVEEWSTSAMDTFPHVYGPINIDAVIDVIAI
jgi:uncharacterized protein (DUF952 family)